MSASIKMKGLIGLFAVVMTASLVYTAMQPDAMQSAGTPQKAAKSQEQKSTGTDDRTGNEAASTAEVSQGATESGDEWSEDNGDVAAWFTSMEHPERPVHEIVARYKGEKSRDRRIKAELIKGLTYCHNRRSMDAVVGSHRSQGDVAAAAGLMDEYHAYLKYCSSLNPSSFQLRETVIGELAEGGDLQAKSHYFEVGPLGRWPSDAEYLPMTQQGIAAWNEKAIRYLNEALKAGDRRSLKTLATIYGTRGDSILGGLHNESWAYAYETLWIASVLADPRISKEAKEGMAKYRADVEGKFTPETRREGLKKAQEIRAGGIHVPGG